MTPKPLMRQAMLAALLALAGCASPSPARQWLSLPLPKPLPLASHVHAATPPAATRVLVVRRVGIPEYLQTDKVRYRQADTLLAPWPHTVWAEPLALGLTDHLVMRLRLALPGWTVCERSCPALATSTTLNVDFAPLDHVRAEGVLRAQAHWLLSDKGANANTPGTTTDTVAVHPDSPEGQAMALAQVLDHLAGDIAAALSTKP
jgi:uncharacterized lipoprotein YmbA